MSKSPLTHERASEIAIAGLTHLAGDDEEMTRFLALTGLTADELRSAATETGFLVGVLDFFMGFEPSLLKFAENADIAPQEIVHARHTLAGPEGGEF